MWRRSVAAVGAVLIASASALVSAPVISAVEDDDTAVARFGACLGAQKAGSMLLMIDESGSLQTSDREAKRVAAAKYMVQQLTQSAADGGYTLDIAVAGFSDTYHQELGWTKLDNSSLPTIESTIDGFAARNTGLDTDYWLAMEGAMKTFAEAPSPGEGGEKCQALAWFTDGKLDYNVRPDVIKPYAPNADLSTDDGKAALIAAATESICREQGMADQLRSSGIITFGIGLAPTPEQATDFDLFKAIVTGAPSGAVQSCGAITTPVPGDFYLAQNIDDLLFAFNRFTTPGTPPREFESGACAGAVCEEYKHRFVLDRSVKTVTVLAAADRTGLVPYVVAPDGAAVALDNGPADVDLGGVSISYRPQGERSVSFRMTNASAPLWQGVWALVYVDPAGDAAATTRTSIHITGDLGPVWPDADATTLHSGADAVAVTFAVEDSQGAVTDPNTLLGQASLTAVLVDVTGEEHPVADLPKDQITAPQTLDLTDVPPGAATLELSLNITTADAPQPDGTVVPGTVLAPARVDLPLTIDPPVGYPTVGGVIDFGEFEGIGPVEAALTISGAGCAWLPDDAETSVAAAPDGVGDITLASSANSADNCVKNDEGQENPLPVTLTVQEAGNGVVNGTTTVMVSSADGSGDPVAIEVDYTASLLKPLDVQTFWLGFIAALILGPGIPLLLLYLSKYLVSRIPVTALRAQEIPIRVNGATVLRGSEQFALLDGDLVSLVPGLDRPTRRLAVGGITLRTRIGLSPFGAGFVTASAPGVAGAGGAGAAMYGKTPDAKLPLAVHNTWFVLHDSAGPADQATVVVLASGDAGPSTLDKLAREINQSLPQALSSLRSRAVPAGAAPRPEPGPPNPFAPADPYANTAAAPNPFDQSGGFGAPPGPSAPTEQFTRPGYSQQPPTEQFTRPGGPNPYGPNPYGPGGDNPFAPGGQGGQPPDNPYPGGRGDDSNNPFR